MRPIPRRTFLQTTCGSAAALLASPAFPKKGPRVVTPLPRQARWQDFELGLLYHYDLDVWMPGGSHHERSRRKALDPKLYNPTKLDTDQWIEAAKAAGAGYAILTATHHQGFLQWQSDLYPFGVKQAPWRDGKGDLVADFVESCRKADIAPGIYLGIRFNAYRNVYGYKVNGGRGGDPEKRRRYMRLCEKMVEELCSRYGDLCELWFDGGVISPSQGGPDVLPIVDKHQPNMVFYHSPDRAEHRWAGSESGTTGYPCWATMPSTESQTRGHTSGGQWRDLLKHGDPNGKAWCPAMADAPVREHDWLWKPDREHRLQPLDTLVDMYVKSVGRNANLILGAVPDRDGLVPEPDMRRFAEMGRAIRQRFGHPAAETQGKGQQIELPLPKPQRIACAVVMEDIRQGERVREYAVEGLVPGNRWETLCTGTSVGHKRIEQFKPVEVARVRLRVPKSIAPPIIGTLAVYPAG
jgi:alpha-L-fucosidase